MLNPSIEEDNGKTTQTIDELSSVSAGCSSSSAKDLQEQIAQDKEKEINFFVKYADSGEYNVLSPRSRNEIISRCLNFAQLEKGATVCDLGCGSGVFTKLIMQKGYCSIGLDLCEPLIKAGKRRWRDLSFVTGDAEKLPFQTESLDGVFLSGLIHHFPNTEILVQETHRVLKKGGVFMAFDPNLKNPFMKLYRDPQSLFYSSNGVTENEKPILANEITTKLERVGFSVNTDYLSASYRYIASSRMRWALPIYNTIERLLFSSDFMKSYRAFLLTYGIKRG